jgi:hypothetical protein
VYFSRLDFKKMNRIEDLPLYGNEGKRLKRAEVWVKTPESENEKKSILEQYIGEARKGTCDAVTKITDQTKSSVSLIQTTRQNLSNQLNYIRSETNIIPKVIFVSLSGFGGALLAFRRSAFRKVVYGTFGATAALAVCCPAEAQQYSSKAYGFLAKQFKDNIWPGPNVKQPPQILTVSLEPEKIDDKKIDGLIKLKSNEFSKGASKLTGDKGQSSDEDKDMYTTRSK